MTAYEGPGNCLIVNNCTDPNIGPIRFAQSGWAGSVANGGTLVTQVIMGYTTVYTVTDLNPNDPAPEWGGVILYPNSTLTITGCRTWTTAPKP
jgi:hypothetical protein